jgi:hypothetical protein
MVPVEDDVNAEVLSLANRAVDGGVIGVLRLQLQADPDGVSRHNSTLQDPRLEQAQN